MTPAAERQHQQQQSQSQNHHQSHQQHQQQNHHQNQHQQQQHQHQNQQPRRELTILYGSQTGCAEDVARRIARDAWRHRIPVAGVLPLDRFDRRLLASLSEPAVFVFVCSTTGQGEEPDAMKQFWRFLLQRSIPPSALRAMRYTVFGLGDSSYAKFNFPARKLFKRLAQLGATAFHPLGEGDDQHYFGFDGGLEPWLQGLFDSGSGGSSGGSSSSDDGSGGDSNDGGRQGLAQFWPAEMAREPIARDILPPPSYIIRFLDSSTGSSSNNEERNRNGNGSDNDNSNANSNINGDDDGAHRNNDASNNANDNRNDNRNDNYNSNRSDASITDNAISTSNTSDASNIGDTSNAADLDQITMQRGFERMQLVQNERVTSADHFQDVRHCVFVPARSPDTGAVPAHARRMFAYSPGDIVDLQPQNLAGDVDALLRTLLAERGWWSEHVPHGHDPAALADRPLLISPSPRAVLGTDAFPRPVRTTLRELFTRQLDVFGVPRRSFLAWLALFTASDMEQERLGELSAPDGIDDFITYAQRPRRTAAEVLDNFPGVRIPLEYLLDALPLLRPRSFSIASAPDAPDAALPRLELLVAIVSYRTIMSTQRHGVFTKYLASLECGASAASPVIVHGRTRRGTMRLADAAHTPVIMVGPGTGVAPMRSFVQARARLGPASSASSTSPNVLFFGCRSRSSDDYFAAEFGRYAADGRLERHTAYSRESAAKTYVQHKVASAAADMWRLIDGGAHVYVSGSSGSMPAEVRAAFAAAISTHGGMSSDAAYDYIRALEKAGRYCEECWS